MREVKQLLAPLHSADFQYEERWQLNDNYFNYRFTLFIIITVSTIQIISKVLF